MRQEVGNDTNRWIQVMESTDTTSHTAGTRHHVPLPGTQGREDRHGNHYSPASPPSACSKRRSRKMFVPRFSKATARLLLRSCRWSPFGKRRRPLHVFGCPRSWHRSRSSQVLFVKPYSKDARHFLPYLISLPERRGNGRLSRLRFFTVQVFYIGRLFSTSWYRAMHRHDERSIPEEKLCKLSNPTQIAHNRINFVYTIMTKICLHP